MNGETSRYYPSNALTLDELAYWIAFSRVLGIGPVRFKKLLDFFRDDVAAAWKASSGALRAAGLGPRTIEDFLVQRASIVPQKELERLERKKVRILTWQDDGYPPLLRKIDYAPPVLYVWGTLTDDDRRYTMGIVGTRKMSEYGRRATEHFASELARGKMTIVSGLALGVDTTAHNAALKAGGRTIAVVACGLDRIYPEENVPLAERIAESGAVISAYPLEVNARAGNFSARNAIISGLSLGVIVTEAPARSGALNTASRAAEQGREVFSVPTSIFSPGGSGVNKLIQDGAQPVTSVNDVIERLNLFLIPQQVELSSLWPEVEGPAVLQTEVKKKPKASQVKAEGPKVLPENEEERILLSLLGQEPVHIDELIRRSELATSMVSATLTMMELKGMIKSVGGMYYTVVC